MLQAPGFKNKIKLTLDSISHGEIQTRCILKMIKEFHRQRKIGQMLWCLKNMGKEKVLIIFEGW